MSKYFLFFIFLFYLHQNCHSQKSKIDSLKKKLAVSDVDTNKIDILLDIAFRYLYTKPDSTIFFAEEAESLSKNIEDKKREAASINRKGVGFWSKGNLTNALQSFNKSSQLAGEIGDRNLVARNKGNIALVYRGMGNYRLALNYYQNALVDFDLLKNEERISLTYGNMGEIYIRLNQYDSAFYFFEKAIPLVKKHRPDLQPFYYLCMGEVNWKQNKIELAKFDLGQSLRFAEKFEDLRNASSAHRILAEIYLKENNLEKALEESTQGVLLAEKTNLKEQMYQNYELYSRILERNKDLAKALKYKNLYIAYKDSVQSEVLNNSLQIYEYEKTNSEVNVLKAERERKEAQLNLQGTIIYVGIFMLILSAAAISFIFWSRQKIKSSNVKLNIANREIQIKQDEILVQNEELRQKQEEISSQNDLIARQNENLTRQNTQIKSSIKSALTIQKAILPTDHKLKSILKDYFVLYQPKDIVSGDFYWADQIEGKTYLIVCDCTGHGVPGAFMSLISNNLLENIILAEHIGDPADILNTLHQRVRTALNQEENDNANGMDIGIAFFEKTKDGQKISVTYAGAKRPLYYICPESQEMHILEGTRKSIGGLQNESLRFENRTISIPEGSMLYLGSDGLADQNNQKRARLGEKPIFDSLIANFSKNASEQKEGLSNLLQAQLEQTDQRDDILWIGVRV